MKKLVSWEIVAIVLTVGVFVVAKALGAPDKVAVFVAAFATWASVGVIMAGVTTAMAVAFAAMAGVAAFASAAYTVVALAGVVPFVAADELGIRDKKDKWVIVASLLIEAGAIFGALSLGLTLGTLFVTLCVALRSLACLPIWHPKQGQGCGWCQTRMAPNIYPSGGV